MTSYLAVYGTGRYGQSWYGVLIIGITSDATLDTSTNQDISLNTSTNQAISLDTSTNQEIILQ